MLHLCVCVCVRPPKLHPTTILTRCCTCKTLELHLTRDMRCHARAQLVKLLKPALMATLELDTKSLLAAGLPTAALTFLQK